MKKRCPCLPFKLWQAPDRDRWLAAKAPARTVRNRRGPLAASLAYWRILEEEYGCFLGWLSTAGLLDWTIDPVLRCSVERLDAYVEFMLGRVRPETALHRVTHLRIALKSFGAVRDERMFRNACRGLRRRARQAKRPERPPPPAHLKAAGLNLMALADGGLDPRPRVNAVVYRDGLLIAALAHRPLRRRNWAELRIGVDFRCIGGEWLIAVHPRSIKNHKRLPPLRWPRELIAALERYLDVYRPLLIGRHEAKIDALWVTSRGNPEAGRTLSQAVARRTYPEFGRAWRPHSFRHSVASTATVEDAALLLGNTRAVIQKNYAPADRPAALRRHIGMLDAMED